MKKIFDKIFNKGTKPEDAHRILSDVPPEKKFLVSNGMILSNLTDLKTALETMSEETYSKHVNSEKNDFLSWIAEIHKDSELMNHLSKNPSRESLILRLQSRIMLLELVRDRIKTDTKISQHGKKTIIIK